LNATTNALSLWPTRTVSLARLPSTTWLRLRYHWPPHCSKSYTQRVKNTFWYSYNTFQAFLYELSYTLFMMNLDSELSYTLFMGRWKGACWKPQ
jgi:hypothetical protein